jgi:hypothetical protein
LAKVDSRLKSICQRGVVPLDRLFQCVQGAGLPKLGMSLLERVLCYNNAYGF